MKNVFGQILITHQKMKWNPFIKNWDEKQFKIWCDYHYSVCREQSVLGASNHVVIIGEK